MLCGCRLLKFGKLIRARTITSGRRLGNNLGKHRVRLHRNNRWYQDWDQRVKKISLEESFAYSLVAISPSLVNIQAYNPIRDCWWDSGRDRRDFMRGSLRDYRNIEQTCWNSWRDSRRDFERDSQRNYKRDSTRVSRNIKTTYWNSWRDPRRDLWRRIAPRNFLINWNVKNNKLIKM